MAFPSITSLIPLAIPNTHSNKRPIRLKGSCSGGISNEEYAFEMNKKDN